MKNVSTEIQFKNAKENDIEEIFDMIKLVIQDMRNKNINHWDELYPDKKVLKEDIKKNELYMGFLNDKLVSIYVINDEYDEDYDTGKWEGKELTYKVLHRFCVNPLFQNKKIGTATLNYIENRVKKEGVKSIRLDVFSKNLCAVHLYEKLGYKKVGNIYGSKGRFYLMEKIF